jgi:ABC-type nitrate/sulfonate/bicarbonate transport system ATPase subunit
MTVKAPVRESRTATAGLPGPAAVQLAGVSKAFERREGRLEALRDVSLAVRRGETVGIVGRSGCGKSTLLEIIAGLESPTSGRVSVDGLAGAAERLRRSALMPQKDSLLPWRSALDNAGLALELQGASRAEARRRARALFAEFGLDEFARTPPAELSGGMRQRVAFARTLLAGRSVLLLDEPFASLDSITRAELQEWLLGALARDAFATLLVTHDIEEALFLCDRVLVLSRRPGTVRAEIAAGFDHAAPRAEVVASPRFSELRRRALEALA